MLVNSKSILKKARKNKYAVGHFNVYNMETAQATIGAASKLNSPIILAISPKTIDYAGFETIVSLIKLLARQIAMPIVFHLDHTTELSLIKKAIKAGFTSVMFDGSQLPFEHNIIIAKKVVSLAKRYHVAVEGELGTVFGQEDYIKKESGALTDPKEAMIFVKKTGIDSLAIGIGNVHGKPVHYERLDFDRLKEIGKLVRIPLVLHGASSTSPIKIKKAIRLGISKINIDTDLRIAFSDELKNFLKKNPQIYDPRTFLKNAANKFQRIVEKKIQLFGSQNRA